MSTPYLSIIFAGRNDNYGGDFNDRLYDTIHWMAHWSEQYELLAELLFINYNPIKENKEIRKQIQWPTKNRYLKIRIITVTSEVHQSLIDPTIRKTIPLFEFIAKNIGIRRANGKFVLCTNADILFSEFFFKKCAKRDLKKNCLYRCHRFDFNISEKRVVNEIPWQHIEKKLRKNTFKFFLQGGTFKLKHPINLDKRLKLLQWVNKFRKYYYQYSSRIPYFNHLPYIPKLKRNELFVFDFHCNASGDFALMDRDSWLRTGGYPEDTWISTHTDSLHLINTAVSGIKVKVLPYHIYHRHHERRFDFSKKNPDMDKMYTRLINETQIMLTTNTSLYNNHKNWGLKNVNLPEIEF